MMARRIVAGYAAWLACSCGRIGFDGVTSVPDEDSGMMAAGHDEDGDGIRDIDDVCPHIPDVEQFDADADRVGDACDPRPSAPTERIVLFDPFVAADTRWSYEGPPPVFDGESMSVDARLASFTARLADAPTNDSITIAGRTGRGGTGQRQLTLRAHQGLPFYYCELFDDGSPTFGLAYTLDQSTYPVLVSSPASQPITDNDFSLGLSTAQPIARCATTVPATAQTISGMPPATIVPTQVVFHALRLEVRYDYFVQIRTEP